MQKLNIYDETTQAIISALESADIGKFEKPWFNIGIAPLNAISRKPYRGINHVLLGFKPYTSKFYASYKQWKEKDCQVRKGEKGHRVVFWNFTEDKDTGKEYAFLRYYTVFNAEQVTGDYALSLDSSLQNVKLNSNEAIACAESLTGSYLANENIKFINGDRAYYSPATDTICNPKLGQFKDAHSYYSTLLHEMTHSTGHVKRLSRPLANTFGSKDYAKEELIAELGAAMLCGYLGISSTPRKDHAQYISSWLQILRDDKRFVISAAGKAQKACDYIIKAASGIEAQEETLAA
jgi:antirestriction protein ArdC